MRAFTVLTSVVAVAAASLGVVAVASSAGAAPDDVVLKGRVVDSSGQPIPGISVLCELDDRYNQIVAATTDADGNYSYTRQYIDETLIDYYNYSHCNFLWFADVDGRYITSSWPSGDGRYAGESVALPTEDGDEPAVANTTLEAGGQLAGTATDAKKRGLHDVRVDVLSVKTRKTLTTAQTSPYGGYRVLGLRPGKYKLKIGTGVTKIGYRPVYAGGGSTFDAAKSFTVKASATTAVGRQTVPNTKKLFPSRNTPVLTYDRPLVPNTRVTVSVGRPPSKPNSAVGFIVASRTVDPRTNEPNDALPYAIAHWDYRYSEDNFQPLVLTDGSVRSPDDNYYVFRTFAGRRFVVVTTYSRPGYARASAVSAPTAISQPSTSSR